MVAAPRKVPAGLCARIGRPPCGRLDLRFWGTASKTVAVQHLPYRAESGDHRQKAIPRGLASARGRRAIGDFGTSGSLSLMALVHDRPQWMVGRRERRNGNARVHASHSGTGYESLFATRRFVSSALSRKSRSVGTPERWILFGRQHENEGFSGRSHAFGLNINSCETVLKREKGQR
jgi:hypothetical protein